MDLTQISEGFIPSKAQKQRFQSLLLVSVRRQPSDMQLLVLWDRKLIFKNGENLGLTELGIKELARLGFFLGYLKQDPNISSNKNH